MRMSRRVRRRIANDTDEIMPSRRACQRGQTSHQRISSAECPLNTRNLPSNSPNATTNVYGPYVCHQQRSNFHRHMLPSMEAACEHCGAIMWISDQALSPHQDLVFVATMVSLEKSLMIPTK
ncbi:unnamed protein product [Absidia cylindrospora]